MDGDALALADGLLDALALGLLDGELLGELLSEALGLAEGLALALDEGEALGLDEGELLGDPLGLDEGLLDALFDGDALALSDGLADGLDEGLAEGDPLGLALALLDGLLDGELLALALGELDALELGELDALSEGDALGELLGLDEGLLDGELDGLLLGLDDALSEGLADGLEDGELDGLLLGLLDGLHQMGGIQSFRTSRIMGTSARSQEDNPGLSQGRILPDPLNQLETVHVGHVHVGQHERKRRPRSRGFLQDPERIRSIGHRGRQHVPIPCHFLQDQPVGGVIIHNQNMRPPNALTGHGDRGLGLFLLPEGDRQPEGSSFSHLAFHRDVAAHQFHQAFRYGQSQSRPPEAPCGGAVGLGKAFEY